MLIDLLPCILHFFNPKIALVMTEAVALFVRINPQMQHFTVVDIRLHVMIEPSGYLMTGHRGNV